MGQKKQREYGKPTRMSYDCYDDMAGDMGEVVFRTEFDDYQGDVIYLLKKEGQFGILVLGYGSCSCCDALQACDTAKEYAALFESLNSSIRWFKSLLDAREYVNNPDSKSENWWLCDSDTGKKFLKMLSAEIEK